ncbi:DUF2489 domain-containing protein [Alteromonas halophila]|uniref:DUF2489 domain-containing protein n=1 Tax=Alteromonas halophila TaxID=516698 RepID=A0A918N1W7_9ALTE|nr:DUF2489 domain-containing protein [Alteromonas halophila]GGW96325.1 hypothetical protein GCM10007391_33060 [Alteromonas halophila]
MMWTLLLLAGLAIIAGLGIYAGRLLFMLRQQNQRQQKVRDARVSTITESILTITLAMEQQQCELSEGAIRVVNLLDALPIQSPPDYRQKFPSIHQLFTEISGFAVLEARKKLSPKEKWRQDKAREQVESEHESKVLAELPEIRQFCQQL